MTQSTSRAFSSTYICLTINAQLAPRLTLHRKSGPRVPSLPSSPSSIFLLLISAVTVFSHAGALPLAAWAPFLLSSCLEVSLSAAGREELPPGDVHLERRADRPDSPSPQGFCHVIPGSPQVLSSTPLSIHTNEAMDSFSLIFFSFSYQPICIPQHRQRRTALPPLSQTDFLNRLWRLTLLAPSFWGFNAPALNELIHAGYHFYSFTISQLPSAWKRQNVRLSALRTVA